MSNPYSANQNPDLSLAQTPDMVSGSSVTNMPVALPPIPRAQPVLQSPDPYEDLHRMGIVDSMPYYDLNLAGVNPLPRAPYATPSGNAINVPTFGEQNYEVPPLQPYDLQEPGVDLVPEFHVDRQVGDLLQFERPRGLEITTASSAPLALDAMAPDLDLYDRPDDLALPDSMLVDPLLPDLQEPDLAPEVQMEERPGELSPQALGVLHADASYETLPGAEYEKLWMIQSGNNAARERHLGMLGLEGEEGGRA